MFFKYKLFSFHIKKQCNKPVQCWLVGSCIFLNCAFRTNWSYRFSNIFSPIIGGKVWRKAHPSTPNEKKHSLLTFKHFLFIFMTFFPPFFFPMWPPFEWFFPKKVRTNFFFLKKVGSDSGGLKNLEKGSSKYTKRNKAFPFNF